MSKKKPDIKDTYLTVGSTLMFIFLFVGTTSLFAYMRGYELVVPLQLGLLAGCAGIIFLVLAFKEEEKHGRKRKRKY